MCMLTLVLATTNEAKLRELRALLCDLPLEVIGMAQVLSESFSISETGQTFEENAMLKARAVCHATGLHAIGDDSGLEVEALGAALESSQAALPDHLPNAFQRQMLAIDTVHKSWTVLLSVAGRVALSGAGPAIFSWHANEHDARETFREVRSSLVGDTFTCRALPPHADQSALSSFVHLLAGSPDDAR